MIRAIQEPTLPKPWTMKVVSPGSRPSFGAASSNITTQPRPVAASRPKEPSSEIGLPVTHAGLWPLSFPYSSIIQAIVWALVPTSGAGMSRLGPSTLLILSISDRVDVLQLVLGQLDGVDVDAALGAAEGDACDGRLPGHHRGQRADLVVVDLGVEAHPALVGAAGAVVLDPVAVEDVHLAVGELDRDLHRDLAIRLPEDLPRVLLEAEPVPGLVEVVANHLEVRDLRRAALADRVRLRFGVSGPSVSSRSAALRASSHRVRSRGHRPTIGALGP